MGKVMPMGREMKLVENRMITNGEKVVLVFLVQQMWIDGLYSSKFLSVVFFFFSFFPPFPPSRHKYRFILTTREKAIAWKERMTIKATIDTSLRLPAHTSRERETREFPLMWPQLI